MIDKFLNTQLQCNDFAHHYRIIDVVILCYDEANYLIFLEESFCGYCVNKCDCDHWRILPQWFVIVVSLKLIIYISFTSFVNDLLTQILSKADVMRPDRQMTAEHHTWNRRFMTCRPTDISLHGHFTPWKDISPHRRFAPWAFRPMDVSPHSRFAPETIHHHHRC